MGMYMNMDRGPFYNKGISPRQRRVFILRWNPSISSFSTEDFENENSHNFKAKSHLTQNTL